MMASNSRDPLDPLRKVRWLLDPLGIWDDAQQRAREAATPSREVVSEVPQERPALRGSQGRRRGEQPALAPAVIGPRARRQAPKELEFFADSQAQILASTHPYRVGMDAAFRKAIERVRAGESRP